MHPGARATLADPRAVRASNVRASKARLQGWQRLTTHEHTPHRTAHRILLPAVKQEVPLQYAIKFNACARCACSIITCTRRMRRARGVVEGERSWFVVLQLGVRSPGCTDIGCRRVGGMQQGQHVAWLLDGHVELRRLRLVPAPRRCDASVSHASSPWSPAHPHRHSILSHPTQHITHASPSPDGPRGPTHHCINCSVALPTMMGTSHAHIPSVHSAHAIPLTL